MPPDAYYITNETSEDRLDCAGTLQEALNIARSLAREGMPGEPVCIEHQGKNIRQLVLTPEGDVREETLV
jgi:hypothetical protein